MVADNDRVANLKRILAMRTAPAWLPATGDILTAILAGVRLGESEYGGYPVLIMETPNGDFVSVHAFHTLLVNQLAEIAPSPGDVLTVQYVGFVERTAEQKAKGKNDYHHYVLIDGDGSEAEPLPAFDWSNPKGKVTAKSGSEG